MAISAARASGVRGRARPAAPSARCNRASSAAASRRWSTNTWQRESSAAFSSNDGFSVVAPMRVMVPSSSTGRNASCCDFMNRWISSTNKRVPPPRRRASSKATFRSRTPAKMAESWTMGRPASRARMRAMVVLPHPGGPQRMRQGTRPPATICSRRSTTAPCPTTSRSAWGRRRSARGRGVSAVNRSGILRPAPKVKTPRPGTPFAPRRRPRWPRARPPSARDRRAGHRPCPRCPAPRARCDR